MFSPASSAFVRTKAKTRTALKICRAGSACWDAIPVPMNITFRDGCALLWSAERAFCKRVACIRRMQFKGLGFPNKHFATQMVFVYTKTLLATAMKAF